MIERDAQRHGLQWEPALTNGFIHDGWVNPIAFPNWFRDVTIPIISPWHWNLEETALPTGVGYDQIDEMRLIFRFKDVADFRIVHERHEREISNEKDTWVESSTLLESPRIAAQAIYLWSQIDENAEGIRSACEAHGGEFRSVHMKLTCGSFIDVVFRDCHCCPSDWIAYEAWSGYPFWSDIQVPPLRITSLATAGRYIPDYKRHLCTTRITQKSTRSPAVEVYYMCEDCLDDRVGDYGSDFDIPRVDSGTGTFPANDFYEESWERGRYPGKKCQCDIERPID